MPSSPASTLLALQRLKAVPQAKLASVADDFSTAEDLLASLTEQDSLFDTGDFDAELRKSALDLERWDELGIRAVTVFDDEYPTNLRTVHNRPALLYVRGTLVEEDVDSVAVVGARAASDEGLRRSGKIAAQLVDAGYVVVSGLAAGIDTAAHRGALAKGRRTVAVIGTGHSHSYPAANAALQDRLASEHAVVSQFVPEQGPTRWTFPLRNAVMSGFAQATVVVEATNTSGARMQARLALEHGRPVFLLQSLVAEHRWAQEHAQRPGVQVISDTSEIVQALSDLYPRELVAAA